nr:precorrin-2 C(20)-methyltransferase [Rhodoligotrophos defluvii]
MATLYGIGLGPGDPELVTLKAKRLLGSAPVTAFFAKRGRPGQARMIAEGHLNPATRELRFDYPFTADMDVRDPRYHEEMEAFYDRCAMELAACLDQGWDVAVLCEGDPFFYGSFMYVFDRLHGRYASEVVPGVTGMSGCWTRAGAPIAHGDDVLLVLPGTLPQEAMVARLRNADAAVFMKVGRHLGTIRRALAETGLIDRAILVEGGTMAHERVQPLAAVHDESVDYFSIVLVPGRQRVR